MSEAVKSLLDSCLTVRQVALKLGVSWQTVYRWYRQGRLRAAHNTRPLLFQVDDVIIPPRAKSGPDALGRPGTSTRTAYRHRQK